MRALIAAILLLLASVSVAHAENAWVLWSQEIATEPGLAAEDKKAWRPLATFESKSGCFSDASTKAEEELGSRRLYGTDKERKLEVLRLGLGEDHLAVKSTFTGGLFDGARMWTYYRCLPDNVAPRGLTGTR
jgi:hypothetical protein